MRGLIGLAGHCDEWVLALRIGCLQAAVMHLSGFAPAGQDMMG